MNDFSLSGGFAVFSTPFRSYNASPKRLSGSLKIGRNLYNAQIYDEDVWQSRPAVERLRLKETRSGHCFV